MKIRNETFYIIAKF